MCNEQVIPAANKRLLERFGAKERQHFIELAEAGQLVGLGRMAELLGVTPDAITDAEVSHRCFSLEGVDGSRLYPVFFASTRLKLEQLEAVSIQLHCLPGPSKWQFFTTPRLSLGGLTPIEALESGGIDVVLAAALAFRET